VSDEVKKRLSGGFVGVKVKENGAKKGKTQAQRELISKRRARIQTAYMD